MHKIDNKLSCVSLAGLTNVTGPISAGYFAIKGLHETATPNFDYKADEGVCWKGHYCPEGTSIPIPCPVGTYRCVMMSPVYVVM